MLNKLIDHEHRYSLAAGEYLAFLRDRVTELEKWGYEKKLYTTYIYHLDNSNKSLNKKIAELTDPNRNWLMSIINKLSCKSYNSIDIEPMEDNITTMILKELENSDNNSDNNSDTNSDSNINKSNSINTPNSPNTPNRPNPPNSFYKKPNILTKYLPTEFTPEIENLISF